MTCVQAAACAAAFLIGRIAALYPACGSQQLKGAAILEPISVRPQHPSVTHYLIHLYDYPPAQKGLGTAIRAGGAACAAHALPHLHARRSLGGVNRGQRRRRERQRKRRTRRGLSAITCTAGRVASPRFAPFAGARSLPLDRYRAVVRASAAH